MAMIRCVDQEFLDAFFFFFFFFNDTATTEIYTLSLHDALPISAEPEETSDGAVAHPVQEHQAPAKRSEEHTSELQSQSNLVCRLLLEKKKKNKTHTIQYNIKLSNHRHTEDV